MKRLLNLYCCVTVMIMMMFTACEQEQNASTDVNIEGKSSTTTTTTVKGEESTVTTVQNASLLANQYFWGTWVKMSDGAEYVINETDCRYSSISNTFSSSTDTTLTVSGLGTFTKQSDSVMVMDNIPYYRKGGANLEYSIRVVGFTDGRAGGTYGQANKRVTGKSQKYTSYTSETQTNSDGMAKLIAPTANDFQTVTVENDNGVSVSVSDICVERSGANMGTIALVNAEQPNLKVTGTIDEYYKDDGYMYIGIPYPMTLTIKNISSNMMKTSIITITSADDTLTVTGNTKFQMSSLAYGGTRTETLSLNCGDINVGYIDTGLKISIENILDGVTWEDFVPLRFHRKKTHFSFSAECPDNNSGASLKGYIIYPDGNSQYFTVADKGIKTIYVPEFCADEPYLMVFCGALANTGTVSTEMFYTVARSNMSIPIDISTIDKQRDAIRFGDYGGEKNDTEDTALSVTQAFQAYLSANDIDYYKMYLNVITHTVLLDNDDGTDSQSLVTLDIGDVLPTIAVPSREGYVFGGYWSEQNGSGVQYIDNNGYNVMLIDKSVTTLYAKWTVSASPSMPTDTTSDSSDDTSGATTTSTTTTTTTIGGGQVSLTVTGNIKIGNVEYDKTSFVRVRGTEITITGTDDNWSGYLDSSAPDNYKGAFINGRTVKISPYYIAQYQVTQQFYEAVMNSGKIYNYGKSDTHPAYYVSWYDAITFCNKLSLLMGRTPCYTVSGITDWSGLAYSSIPTSGNSTWNAAECDITKNGYRLPTEAEWEFAARGGDPSKADWKYAFSGIDVAGGNKIHDGSSYLKKDANLATVGWYSSNSGSSTHPVGEKLPNRLGLYDMSGNVWEWCQDWYNATVTSNDSAWTVDGVVTNPMGAAFGSLRVRRGGIWDYDANCCCVSSRGSCSPNYRDISIGFRPICSAE